MKDKIERSIRLLQMFASSIGGGQIELSYSGGKDSDVILELAKMAGIPFRGIYKATTIDPPGTIAHCRENGIEVVRPKRTFFELMSKYGFPTRYMRFCCGILKEYKILDNAIQGIRKSESSARNKRYDSNDPIICRTYGSKKDHVNVCLPILDWTDEDVEDFIKDRGITCHPVYYDNDGKFYVERRLGCIGCPLQSRKNRIAQFEKYPGFILSYVRLWGEVPHNAQG